MGEAEILNTAFFCFVIFYTVFLCFFLYNLMFLLLFHLSVERREQLNYLFNA